jgi:3-hydroxyacyl-[acyl-carrier-protein] dehydratase
MNNKTLSNIKITEILTKIPHRYPFILVDRVINLNPGVDITAVKNVAGNEPCFQGHFPENPVMPGVLILESLAQACALLFIYSIESQSFPGYTAPMQGLFLFAGMDNVRFKKVVMPGDQIILQAELVKYKKDVAKFSAKALVDDQVACTADLLTAYRELGVQS